MNRFAYFAALSLVCASIAACKDDAQAKKDNQGATPPPSANPSAGGATGKSLCEPTMIAISDAKVAALLPTSFTAGSATFCVQKGDPVRSWGDGTKNPKMDDVSDIIDGNGELYSKNYYAKRYDSLKYVDGKGTDAAIDVAISTFDKPENAYALFTYRVVANADPDPDAMKKAARRPWQAIKSGAGAAALGNANALVWKGNYLVELTYSPDTTKTLAEATAAGDAILPKLVEAIGDKIMGSVDLPADVRALPTEAEGRIALGVEYVPSKYTRPEGKGDALRINVAGGYATGYMRDLAPGAAPSELKRYRVLAFARDDRDAARDAFSAFQKLPGAIPLKDKDVADDAVHFAFAVGSGGAGAPGKAEGIAVRKGTLVLAVTDEELALGDSASKTGYPRLSKEEKVAKAKKLLDARSAVPAPASSNAAPAPSVPPAPPNKPAP